MDGIRGQGVVAIAAALGVTALLWRGAREPGSRRLVGAATLLAACQAALILVTRLVADEGTPFDWRILSPIMLLVALGVAASLGAAWRTWGRGVRVLASALVLAWFAGSARLVALDVEALGSDGWGYAGEEFQQSDLTAWLRRDGARYRIFSNHPPTVYALAHRHSRLLPATGDSGQVARLAAVIGRAPSAVIWFADPRLPALPEESLVPRARLQRVGSFDIGTVWVTPDR